MDNLFDILRNAQNGQAIDNLAHQFHLSQQQAQAAVEALLPAFSLGLKRQVDNARVDAVLPPNFFGLTGLPQIDAFHNAALAFTQQATQQGNMVIAALFGSNDLTRAVTRQAAMQSGVAAPVLAAMLPALASILVSGLTQAILPHTQSGFGQGAAGHNPLGSLFGSMMKAFHPQTTPPPSDANLLAALWAPFLGAGAEPAKPSPPTHEDLFEQLLETGHQVHKVHADAMQSVFDAWFGRK